MQNFTNRLLECHYDKCTIYVSGIGKSGIVARRLASTLSSISIRSQWIHGAEWTHGELGSLKKGDVV
jgi:arabinose-5-phosphate isomerase